MFKLVSEAAVKYLLLAVFLFADLCFNNSYYFIYITALT